MTGPDEDREGALKIQPQDAGGLGLESESAAWCETIWRRDGVRFLYRPFGPIQIQISSEMGFP
ncbi:MAG TPA: hypothetical protein DCF63_14625 [Planctomycetaceae bacterium]|nr:hypothetical protein [Planctomycetaceae bacterium]